MNNPHDAEYTRVLKDILDRGIERPNRTGVGTLALPAATMSFDLAEGFPLLTLKKMPWRTICVELEGFIHGVTSKRWYQDRGCHIWDEWCNPEKVPYGHDDETKAKMAAEDDLGPIYGAQWRNFMGFCMEEKDIVDHVHGRGMDQLWLVLASLRNAPDSRRMVVSAWNPLEQPFMALPPCHVLWQVLVIGVRLHLNWYQRSCDWFLGIPFNVASYSLLAMLLANHAGLQPGVVTGFFGDSHLYENQLLPAKELLSRESFTPPSVWLPPGQALYDWKYGDAQLEGYESHPAIKVEVVV